MTDQLSNERGSHKPEVNRSFLEKFLGLFAEVRRGEGATVLLLTANVFLLFTAYYIIKPVREAFILQGGESMILGWVVGKAELKSYASAGMAFLLVGIVSAYGRLASTVPRQKLITIVTLFFISNLFLFYLWSKAGVSSWLGLAFFLWVGIFNMLVVAQFWSFANDVYLPDQGKRLFAIVGFGASIGAVLGSTIAGWIIVLGEPQMLLVSGAILGSCIVLTNIVHQREVRRAESNASARAAEAEKPLSKAGGFHLVLHDRYLLLIAFLILLANFVNSTGEFILSKKITSAAAQAIQDGTAGGLSEGQFIGKFYSDFFMVVNVVSLVIQLFLVSRILKYLGVRVALMILPVIALGGYAFMALGASLGVVRIIKTLENSTDYSLQNTTRHVLFLPTSREVKYKAKAAIDTFFVRVGDFASALLVFIGSRMAFGIEKFAMANALFVIGWILLAIAIVKRHKKITASNSTND